MISKIQAWFAAHNFSSHTLAGVLISAGTLYATNAQVKAIVDGFLSQHKNLSGLFGAAFGVYLKYSASHKTS